MARSLTSNELSLESGHVYRLAEDPERRFESATEFVESFFEPFDQWAIASKLCAEHDKYRDMLPEDLIAEWNAATRDGTRVHEEIEEFIRHRTEPLHPKAEHARRWIDTYLPADRFVLAPEVRVYSDAHGLAGTIDLPVYDQDDNCWILFDWKTNKKIHRAPYNGKTGIRGPGEFLGDCHLVKYSLQLSTYAYILEAEYGIHPRHLALLHLTEAGVEAIEAEYMRDTVVDMLEWREENAA